MKIKTEFILITFAHICLPRQQFKVFQSLECHPLLSMMRVLGNIGTTVKVQLGSIEEQDSLWFSGLKEAQRLEARRAGGGVASDGAPMETTGRPPKSAYLLWPTSQVSSSAAGRKQRSQCLTEKKPAGCRELLFSHFSDNIFGPLLLFLLNTSSKRNLTQASAF